MIELSNPSSNPPIAQTQPTGRIVGTLKNFNSLKAYIDYYDAITLGSGAVGGMSMTYEQVWDAVLTNTRGVMSRPAEAINWLGEAYPQTIDELFSRTEYPLMDEYRDVYERIIKPRLEEIVKESKALLDVPTLKYNDIGLGLFDFGKASLGLMPLYKYYSLKNRDYVEGYDTYVSKYKNGFRTYLKSDNSDVVVVPELKEGYDEKILYKAFREIWEGENVFKVLKKYNLNIGKFTSTIKKVFLYKENVPKPLNSVRIFIYVGGNSNVTAEQFKWTGYTGIGISELLFTLGYNVSVHAAFSTATNINFEGRLQDGLRASTVTLKPFTETFDSKKLLYVTSDPSFFRGREFSNIVKKSQEYGDYITDRLGYSVSTNQVKDVVFKGFGSIDKIWNKDGSYNINSGMLYYIVANIRSEQDMNQAILDIALSVVNENAAAKQAIGIRTQP